ncbi:MAG: PepSY-like domain-containing protein [Ignavibacteria bacterium]
MKNFILFTLILVFSVSLAFSQHISEKKVPQAVKDAFYTKFPNTENVRWGLEDAEYEAEFKLNNVNTSASYSEDGTWLETETEIDATSLPQAVIDAVNRDYNSATIYGASRIEKSDKSILYEADIKVKSKKKEVLYDEKGNPVQ